MDSDLNSDIEPDFQPRANPDAKWIAWAVWSAASLTLALLVVVLGDVDPGLLLGWIIGVIVAAMLMVFRRR